MHIKITLALFWLGIIFTNVLHANNIYKGNRNMKSDLSSESVMPDSIAINSSKKDSAKINSYGETGAVNLPFAKSYKNNTAGAITVFNPENLLMYDNSQGIYDAISGLIPGSFGGINIRGLGDALVVIDGIPRPINSVNIEEIEQITVLKDVNAAILYGVQGNNGIIMIKTKRGKSKERKVNVSVEKGFSKPISLPKYLGSADYMGLYNEALANDGLAALYSQDQIDGTRSKNNPALYPDVDYYSSEFLKNAVPATKVVAEFSGGNDNAQYYLSTGMRHTGTLLNMGEGANQKNERFNLRSNINFKITNSIKSYVDVVAIWDIARRANGDYWGDASTLTPNLYTPLIDTAMVTNKQYINTAALINGRYMVGGKTGYTNNVYANLNLGGYYSQVNTSVQFNNGIDFDLNSIAKGLSFKTFISFDFYNQFRETQNNTYAVYQPEWSLGSSNEDLATLKKIGIDKFNGTQGVANSVLMRNFGVYGVLDYSRTFGTKHVLAATMVAYAENYTETGAFYSDKNANLGMRINYVNSKKYIIDFNSALVSSAKLYSGNRIGFSPSLALGWIVSEENFLKNSSIVDFLKLKVSAGNLKTDKTIPGYYLYEGIYQNGSTYTWNDGNRSLTSSTLSSEKNYDLSYQQRKEVNVGAEAVLFNRSLWLDVNIFQERNTNMVVKRVNAYPEFLGSFYPYENYGEEKYTGFELGATLRKLIGKDLIVELGANMVYVSSEVVRRDETWGFDYLYRTGKPVSAAFGLEAMGLFKDNADIAGHPTQSFGVVRPGDIKYKDQNNDNIIDANDEVMIGQGSPKLAGGLNLKLKYKNITFYALATGRSGSEGMSSNAYYWVYSDRKYSEVVTDRWTPATAETATYPRLTSQSSSNNFRSSTFWLYDSSMIRIDRLQLSYDLPNSLYSKLSMKALNLYVRGSNLATLSKNHEKMNLNIGSEPQSRYYAIGLKASF